MCNFIYFCVIYTLPEDDLLEDESCTFIWVCATNIQGVFNKYSSFSWPKIKGISCEGKGWLGKMIHCIFSETENS